MKAMRTTLTCVCLLTALSACTPVAQPVPPPPNNAAGVAASVGLINMSPAAAAQCQRSAQILANGASTTLERANAVNAARASGCPGF